MKRASLAALLIPMAALMVACAKHTDADLHRKADLWCQAANHDSHAFYDMWGSKDECLVTIDDPMKYRAYESTVRGYAVPAKMQPYGDLINRNYSKDVDEYNGDGMAVVEAKQTAAPAQEQAPQRTADNPDLDSVKVDVVDQGVVWNDWSKSRIRVIKATGESGGDMYFYCDTVLRGANGNALVINGKPLSNAICFAPKLHAIYTLHDIGSDGSYWMTPPGLDADDADGKRIMVRYCPKCDPDSQ